MPNLFQFAFHSHQYKKEKKGEHTLQFKSGGDKAFEKIPKTFNHKTIVKVLAQFEVTAKTQPAIMKMLQKGVTETKKELSAVCVAIVLYSIQDRKREKEFSDIKKLMRS